MKTKLYIIIAATCLISCESFLKVEGPKSKITSDLVFDNDVTATSAVTGIYFDMLSSSGFASGSTTSISFLTGLSSDELHYFDQNQSSFTEFETNSILSTNPNILALWGSMYNTLYSANAAIEGLNKSTSVTASTKSLLIGEALFIRAFTYHYLSILFGDVPLITDSNYLANSNVQRTDSEFVVDQIVNDLSNAINFLGEDYPTMDDDFSTPARIRPNKSAAKALLARIYLYKKDWQNAEKYSSEVISNMAKYSLNDDLNQIFLKNSSEAIFQLRPVAVQLNTLEGYYFILRGSPTYAVLNLDFINSFEMNDKRFNSWVGSIPGDVTYYFPYKYKRYENLQADQVVSEYSMVLRLAEQYLIRAEAKAQSGNTSGAIEDLDAIRRRAGLTLVKDTNSGINKMDLLKVIAHERQIELFSEWGHRWFDLVRSGEANSLFGSIKQGWTSNDAFFPIPQSEFQKNKNLQPQNPGY